MSHTFSALSKNSLSNPRFQRFFFSYIFLLKILYFTFKPVTHFEVCFYADVCPFTPAPFVEKAILTPWNYLCTIVKN